MQFYTSVIIVRWQTYIDILPWQHTLDILLSAFHQGAGDRAKLMRRTIVRYLNISYIYGMSGLSPQVRRRFPTLDHLVPDGTYSSNCNYTYINCLCIFNYSGFLSRLLWTVYCFLQNYCGIFDTRLLLVMLYHDFKSG